MEAASNQHFQSQLSFSLSLVHFLIASSFILSHFHKGSPCQHKKKEAQKQDRVEGEVGRQGEIQFLQATLSVVLTRLVSFYLRSFSVNLGK